MATHLNTDKAKNVFLTVSDVNILISEDMLHFLTFPPRLAFGGFPAFTTLVGPGGSVESHRKTVSAMLISLNTPGDRNK